MHSETDPSPFAILGLEPRPQIEHKALHEAFLREAARHHPDASPDPDAASRFRQIQSARRLLEDPVTNLQCFLESLAHPSSPPPPALTPELPAELVALFSALSPFRASLEECLAKIQAARTPIARALAERELAALRARTISLEKELEKAWKARECFLQEWWLGAPPRDPSPLWNTLRDMKFLQKWRIQPPAAPPLPPTPQP